MAQQKNNGYLNNPQLPKKGTQLEYTADQLIEMKRCMDDIIYFALNYFTIVHIDKGKIKIPLYEYQKNLLLFLQENRFSAILQSRQSGKTTTNTVFILHYILFNTDKKVAILANKASTTREILSRIKLAYELLPNWLKPGVVEWNKGSVEFSNGCKIMAAATSSSSIRGESIALLVVDEAAFVQNWDDFYTSTYPTIASGMQSKVILVSTANGLNHYFNIIERARQGLSEYKAFEVSWRDVPGRDEEWKRQTIRNTSEEAFDQEHNNTFTGSSNTLISSKYLKELTALEPIFYRESVRIYEQPIESHVYVAVADTSRGKGLDNSAISIIDVTSFPYKQVATYYNNEVSYQTYPDIIYGLVTKYNNAWTIVENNDVGGHVVSVLNFDLEYDNLVTPDTSDRKKYELGVRTTKKVKSAGCSVLRDYIEGQKLQIPDKNTITELSMFIRKGNSYEADKDCHDDLVMTLVLFAWFTTTEFFADISNRTIRETLYKEKISSIYEDLLPSLVIDDGVSPFDELDNRKFTTIDYESLDSSNESWTFYDY